MTVELPFAAILATAIVLMTFAFRRPIEASNRLSRRGQKITWDRPENISIGEWWDNLRPLAI